MGKFVARTFIPGEPKSEWSQQNDDPTTYAFGTAYEAWDHHLENRLAAEALAAELPTADYALKLYSAAGDMNELAQSEAYDDANIFGVASCGYDWEGSNGTGVIWARTPGKSKDDRTDRGICYEVTFEDTYYGL